MVQRASLALYRDPADSSEKRLFLSDLADRYFGSSVRKIDIIGALSTRFLLHRHSQMIPFIGPVTNEEVTPVRESGQYIKAQTPAELI